MPIDRFSFLAPGNYAFDDPGTGLRETLALFRLGEELGYRGGWIRQRHLEAGVSSAATFLAAASQHTTRLELGSAVIPIGYENPFRLAEDLATVDALSGGRLHVGLSAGRPPHFDLIAPLVFDGDPASVDLSHRRIERPVDLLRSRPLGAPIAVPGGTAVPRVQPHAAGLVDRLWYGVGSLRSADWAGRAGQNLLLSNVTSGEDTDRFFIAQNAQIDRYQAALPPGRDKRIAVGRVVVPTDGADAARRERYSAYAASRHARTLQPNGERRTLFAADLVGPAEAIVERLLADPILARADELRLELPYEFRPEEYRQILEDVAFRVAPALGTWSRA
ncbi:MAG TPA: LLM class flavin-dependent oxidoreductase [Kaistia sp.]|nr:LLM class flavin-dependent oxidoreductase [Kaistia sp.]